MSPTSVLVYLKFTIYTFEETDEYHQMKMVNKGLNDNQKETLKELRTGNPQGGKNQARAETKKETSDDLTKKIKDRAAARIRNL
jgi:hypothetical protein